MQGGQDHVVDRMIEGSEAVHSPSQTLQLSCELAGAPFRRAAKQDVFQEMGQSRLLGFFVGRACCNPGLEGDERRRGVVLDDDPQAVRQNVGVRYIKNSEGRRRKGEKQKKNERCRTAKDRLFLLYR